MLDMSQIVDQSWHHGTYFIGTPIQVQVTFPGTAVYVYNVLLNTLLNATMAANISFMLNGKMVGLFVHNPTPSSNFLYNKLVYANASLADSIYTLIMSVSGSEQSLIFFDYLLYTIEVEGTTSPTPAMTSDVSPPLSATAPSAASSTHLPTAMIVGRVMGDIALLLAIAALLFLVSR